VRFADGQQLFRQLLSMLRTKFLSMNLDATMHLPPSSGGNPFAISGAGPRPRGVELQAWSPSSASSASSLWGTAPRPPIEVPRVNALASGGGEAPDTDDAPIDAGHGMSAAETANAPT